jgi:serine/threonine-protein kinase
MGAKLGNYRVLARLGMGGMGEVFVGCHEALGHRVAVKVLKPEMSSNTDMVRRFFNEAQAATAIRSPGIVQIFDFGTTTDGRAYFVMELLDGESLGARLKQRRLEYAECCRIGRQVANVLHAAHAAGITHRDLKPDNLFLVPDTEVIGGERVKVLDFGIAKLAGEIHASSVKTRTDVVMGTPSYMSPEQSRGGCAIDGRSDIYSLGCILFETVCGRPPFVGEGAGGIIGAHQYVEPPQPRSLAPDIPGKLAKLILQMLAKQPDARPQPMAAVGQALEEILHTLDGAPKRGAKRAPTSSPAPERPPEPTMFVGSKEPSAGVGIRTWLLLALGGLVITALVIAIAIMLATEADDPGSSEPSVADAVIAVAPPADAGAAAAPPTPDAPPPPTPDAAEAPPPPPTPSADEALVIMPDESPATPPDAAVALKPAAGELEVECLRYQSARKWGDLESCAGRLKPTNPARAKEFEARAILETKAAPRVDAFDTALRNESLKRARAALDTIPAAITGYAKLKQRYEQAESAAIQDLIARLERVKGGDCKEYNQIVQQEKLSRPARVAAEATRQVECTPTGPPASQPPCDAEALAQKGREQYTVGQLAAALVSYEAAYSCAPGPDYSEKGFIVACNIPDAEKAKLLWKRLSPPVKQRTLMICVRNQILEETLNAP